MPDRKSALTGQMRPGRYGNPAADGDPVLVAEIYGRRIYQVTAWPETMDRVRTNVAARCSCEAPAEVGKASNGDGLTVMMVAPRRYWIVVERRTEFKAPYFAPEDGALVDLSESRTILNIQGEKTRELLAKGLPIDTHQSVFPANSIAQSGISHISVLVHLLPTLSEDAFDIYVPSGFAVSFWEWLTVAAREFGYEIA